MDERTQYLKRFVDSKLKEREVPSGDHEAAHAALSRCVLGAQLVRAYDNLYNNGGN